MKLNDLIKQPIEGLSEDKAVDIFWQKRHRMDADESTGEKVS
jgi:hypothetical protein